MRSRTMLWVSVIAWLLLIGSAVAEETKPWIGEAEAGGLQTSGNTQTRTLNAAARVIRNIHAWSFQLAGTATSASDRGVATAEHYQADAEARYAFSEYFYTLATVGYDKDRFSGYDHRLSETLGLGYTFLHSDTAKASLELGIGSRQGHLKSKLKETDNIGRSALHGLWQINPTVAMTEDLEAEFGKKGTVYESNTGLTAMLTEILAVKMGYKTHTNTKPVVGFKKTDSEASVNLVYKFL